MKWYIPSWNGDLRLEQDGEVTKLSIVKPTPKEVEVLGQMKTEFISQGWIKAEDWKEPSRWRKREVTIAASIADVGPVASKIMRPGDATLTAMAFIDGEVITYDGAQEGLAEVAQEAVAAGAESAATVPRPTPCCPECMPGAIEPATEVLLAFLTPEQHESWAEDRTMLVEGGLSGATYLLAHRHTEHARKIGRICYDLDCDTVVHFHNRALPPEEEVLSAKLILEHREDWLRNEATMLGMGGNVKAAEVFKNPFGGSGDGVADSLFTVGIGSAIAAGNLR